MKKPLEIEQPFRPVLEGPRLDTPTTKLPTEDDALVRFNNLRALKPTLSEQRVRTLALMWLSFQHTRAHEISEFSLFLRPEISKEGNNDLLKVIQSEITDATERTWLIEGAAGMGKTTFCLYLCNEYWETFLSGQQERMPLYIYLPNNTTEHSHAPNNLTQTQEIFLRTVIAWQSQRVLQDLLSEQITADSTDSAWLVQQPLLLILDGFDELKKMKNYYEDQWSDPNSHYDIKVVYGCRPEALEMEYRNNLFGAASLSGKAPTYRGYQLENLKPEQINSYIKKYTSSEKNLTTRDAQWYRDWLKKLPGLDKVIEVPQLLRIVLDILPDIASNFQENPNANILHDFTQWRIYEEFVRQWTLQQAERIRRDGYIKHGGALYNLKGSLEEYLFSYNSNLARTLWSQNQGHINSSLLSSAETLNTRLVEPRYREPIKGASENEASSKKTYQELLTCYTKFDKETIFSKPDAIKIIRSGSLLRIEGQDFRFIHKTIIEYLTMEAITYNLRNQLSQYMQILQPNLEVTDNQFDINLHPLRSEPNMIRSFVDQFKDDEHLRKTLLTILENSKYTPGLDIAASNAITLLNAMNEDFSKRDLNDVQISQADLRMGKFVKTSFTGANLEGVWFHGAHLGGADFSGANLKNIQLGNSYILRKLSRSYDYRGMNSGINAITTYFADGNNQKQSGSWIAGCSNGMIYRWSMLNYELITKYNHGKSVFGCKAVNYVATHNESHLLVSWAYGSAVRIWSLDTGKNQILGDTDTATCVCLSPDGKYIVAGENTGELTVWSVDALNRIKSIAAHLPSVSKVRFSPDQKWLVSTRKDDVKLWSTENWEYKENIELGNIHIQCISFSSDSMLVAFGDLNGSVKLRSIQNRAFNKELKGHVNRIFDISFNIDNQMLISCSADESVIQWSLATGAPLWKLNIPTTRVCYSYGPDEQVLGLVISNPNALVLVPRQRDKSLEALPSICLDYAERIGISPSAEILARWTWNSYIIRLISIKSHQCFLALEWHVMDIKKLVFSPDNKILAAASICGKLKLWSVETGQEIIVDWLPASKVHANKVMLIIFSGDDNDLLLTYDSGHVVLLILTSTHGFFLPSSWKLSANTSGILCDVHFSLKNKPHLTKVLASTAYGYLTIDTAKYTRDIKGSYYVFSPDGETLAVVVEKQYLALFSIEKNDYQQTIYVRYHIDAVSFSHDGMILATSHADHLTFYAAKTGKSLMRCSTAGITGTLKIHWSKQKWSKRFLVVSDHCLQSYTYNFDPVDDTFTWRCSEDYPLYSFFSGIKITQAINVPIELNKRNIGLIEGASAPKESVYIPYNRIFKPLSGTAIAGAQDPLTPSKGSLFKIDTEIWVISVARNIKESKVGFFSNFARNTSRHTFLILEGIINHCRIVIRAELLTINSQVLINIRAIDGIDYTLEDFKKSAEMYEAQQWAITKKQGLQLLDNIRKDQRNIMNYTLLGGENNNNIESYNCVSWCKKHLCLIDISIPNQWYNDILTYPTDLTQPSQESSSPKQSGIDSP
jgi:WD40 repeat protein